ncbi:MAG: hypothetical protein SCK29_08115 [Bacillota bacterium]|nr:hypothetical protein [Bacillota bacterium]MDW7684061.1 hypothetical protein [Bacillota bacterium]
MQTFVQQNRFVFMGTVRELRLFLQNLPADITLHEFIGSRLH